MHAQVININESLIEPMDLNQFNLNSSWIIVATASAFLALILRRQSFNKLKDSYAM